MFKRSVRALVAVLVVTSSTWSCGNNTTDAPKSTGGTPGSGGTSASGGMTGSGGASAVGGSSAAGGTSSTGGTSATGGAAAGSGGVSASGGVATGGTTATGGSTGGGGTTGTSAMTLAQACKHNCALAAGLPNCSTTTAVCEKNCMTTFDNTSAVNPDLGRQYTEMMICVAGDPAFGASDAFVCAKPNSPLNLWSPGGVDVAPKSTCEDLICLWNCNDATHGNMDPWVDIRCFCSSV